MNGRPARIGGAPYHAGRALRLLERPAQIVARAAASDRPALLPRLAALGLPVSFVDGQVTARFSFTYRGDTRVMNLDAVGDPWTPDDVSAVDRRVGWVHAAPLVRSDFPAETLETLSRGRRLSLDGQGLVRSPELGALRLDADFDIEMLRNVAVLKLAEEEAGVLLDGRPLEDLAELGVPEVVVTFGSRGSAVITNAGLERIPAYPLPQDPTGAGDAFSAVYLASRSGGIGPAGAAGRATALVSRLLCEVRR